MLKNYILYDKNTGRIKCFYKLPQDQIEQQLHCEEDAYLESEATVSQYVDVNTLEIRDIPPKPNDYSEFNWQTKQWQSVESWLDKAKTDGKQQINQLAGQKITAVYPITKQNFLQGRYIELMMLGQTDSDEAKAIATAWRFIKAVKDASDQANIKINQSETLEAITAIVDEFKLFNT